MLKYSSLVCCAIISMSLVSSGFCQGEVPADYSDLNAPELIAEADRLKSVGELNEERRVSLGKRAVDLLSNNEEGPHTNNQLARLAKLSEPAISSLTVEQQQLLESALSSIEFDANDAELESIDPYYDWIHFQIASMKNSGASQQEIGERVAAWIEEVGLEQLSIEKTRWCLEQCLPQLGDRSDFSVAWEGVLVAPTSGEYTFSVFPGSSNKSGPLGECVHSLSVKIGDQQAVNATPESWSWEGETIQLEAGESYPFEAQMTYSAAVPNYGDSPHAILSWKGPGFSRSVVPASAFRAAEQESGLQATYRWFENGGLQESIRSEANIEFAWAGTKNIAPRDSELVAKLKNRLFELATEPEYLASLIGPQDERPAHKHVYFRNYFCAEYLTCAQRRGFLSAINQQPELLRQADATEILRLYQSFRFGDELEAVKVLGNWLHLNGDVSPQFSDNFFDSNRRFYRTIALYLKWRGSDLQEKFEQDYLLTSEDECSLPVAYSLSYCYLMGGVMGEWIAKLDERLADQTLTAKQRIAWLLARAQAAELEMCSSDRFVECEGRLLAGQQWLDEARLIADPDDRLATEKELLTRLASSGSLDSTLSRINELLDRSDQPSQRQELTQWQTQVTQLTERRDTLREDAAAEADLAYRKDLEKQRDAAIASGDDATAASYSEILNSAEITPQQ
jgi:hypothetical protein